MPDNTQKKTFNTIAILGLIVVVLSSILFLFPAFSNDQSEIYKFTLPLVNEISIRRNQLMFILVAELFFMGGIYLLVKGLRSDDEGLPGAGTKKDNQKVEEEPKEEPSSLEKVVAGEEPKAEEGAPEKAEEKKDDASKAEEPKVEEPKKEEVKPVETAPEPARTTGPIHLGDGKSDVTTPR